MSARRIAPPLALAAFLATAPLPSQVVESTADPNGVSIEYEFVHLVHSDDSTRPGTTAWLYAHDPFLLYQLGRDLTTRVYPRSRGAEERPGAMDVPLYVGDRGVGEARQVRFARDHTASCAFCHSMPIREPGAGQTIASTSATGRNTPHFYGAGLVEMIALQTRASILRRADTNGDGMIDADEARRAGRIVITPAPGEPPIDFGTLAPDTHGVPGMNGVFRIWYVDRNGVPLPEARSLDDAGVGGFDFAMEPFGWGRGTRSAASGRVTSEGGEAATIRGIFALAADVHMGLQANDPTQQSSHGIGLAAVSLNGAQQFDFGEASNRDGKVRKLTEGDLDAIEFYLLHAPAPAVRGTAASERGRAVLRATGCTRCHVEQWRIEARDVRRGFDGDRRLFHLETSAWRDGEAPEIVARLVRTPRIGGSFAVDRIYTDFRHWDIGPAFWERRWDGTLQKAHRTAPLWGVCSTHPYGHAGSFDTLDDVIRAHAGAAAPERKAYAALPPARRAFLLRYLESLVLYPTDEVPADIDGDGKIADDFVVGGQRVGYERFDARFLFAVPPRWRFLGDVADPRGRFRRLGFIDNTREAYRIDAQTEAKR
jgi:CxxC motif-containing protein (DUF1111 family)